MPKLMVEEQISNRAVRDDGSPPDGSQYEWCDLRKCWRTSCRTRGDPVNVGGTDIALGVDQCYPLVLNLAPIGDVHDTEFNDAIRPRNIQAGRFDVDHRIPGQFASSSTQSKSLAEPANFPENAAVSTARRRAANRRLS